MSPGETVYIPVVETCSMIGFDGRWNFVLISFTNSFEGKKSSRNDIHCRYATSHLVQASCSPRVNANNNNTARTPQATNEAVTMQRGLEQSLPCASPSVLEGIVSPFYIFFFFCCHCYGPHHQKVLQPSESEAIKVNEKLKVVCWSHALSLFLSPGAAAWMMVCFEGLFLFLLVTKHTHTR